MYALSSYNHADRNKSLENSVRCLLKDRLHDFALGPLIASIRVSIGECIFSSETSRQGVLFNAFTRYRIIVEVRQYFASR